MRGSSCAGTDGCRDRSLAELSPGEELMIVGSTEVRSARVRPSRSGVDALARLSATRMLSASGVIDAW